MLNENEKAYIINKAIHDAKTAGKAEILAAHTAGMAEKVTGRALKGGGSAAVRAHIDAVDNAKATAAALGAHPSYTGSYLRNATSPSYYERQK